MGIFSSKKRGHTTTSNFDLNDMGVMPTMKRQVLGNGMILGLEQNAIWLYGKVPTAPVANARDSDRRMEAYQPLFNALSQIADETPRSALKRRSVTKNNYRNIHILRTNVPKTWHADVVAPRDRRTGQDTLNQWLNASLPETTVKESILALGVQLTPSTTSTGFKGALNSVHFTLMEGGTPLADYERDLEKVKRIFDRAGVTSLSGSEVASLDSWWNPGRNPDVVTLDHPDHLHVIRDKRTTRIIKDLEDQGVDCEDWPADLKDSADQEAGQAVVSFGSISDLKLNFTDPVEDYGLANWAIPLLGARALAISIRGQIEPADITGEELRRNKRNYRNDIEERVKQNKMERPEQEEKEELLGRVGSVYANDRGTPTLISASGLVAFDGKVEDWDTVVRSAAELQAMEHRQSKAWAEMMICSMRNSNPNLMDMPIQNIACSGINDVSKIGDKFGILRGFTELDKQPAYYNVEAAYGEEDAAPMSANIGSSGSGKLLSLNHVLPTPDGKGLRLGDAQVGDIILDRRMRPTRITGLSPIEENPWAYEMTFSDGQRITADVNHQWVVTGGPKLDLKAIEAELSDPRWDSDETHNFYSMTALLFSPYDFSAGAFAGWINHPECLLFALRMVDIAPIPEDPATHPTLREVRDGLLRRARQIAVGTPNLMEDECVLSTGEMLALVQEDDHEGFGLRRLATTAEHPEEMLYIRRGDITSVDPVPMRCITVDSPDSTYLVEGNVPTHNTLLMQWEMFQTDLMGYPQIVVDPKAKSDLTPVVDAMPTGRVYSLDELAKYDGIFDAIKFAPNPDVAVEFALATITALNPYGSDRDMAAAEPDLIQALRYGMEKGHRSTLTALKRATKDGKLASYHVEQIEKLSTSSPMFSALVGHTDEGEGLGAYEGTTLIKVGDQELNLPDPGTPASGIIQRVNLALVRNIVFASAMALNKRKGVLRLDEAWVFTSNSPKELERLGRLARSQTIDVQLYTQRISDALDANLQNYLTRGLILHVRDPIEAAASCQVFNLEADAERIGRIRAAGTLDNDSASPNWNSLKALKDPHTREVIRGSVALYVDIHGRVVPVEIRVPPRFLKLASTNIDDVTARDDEADEQDRIRQAGERVTVPA